MKKSAIYLLSGIFISSTIIIYDWSTLANIMLGVLDINNSINNHQTAKKILFGLNTMFIVLSWFYIRASNQLIKLVYGLLVISWLFILLLHFVIVGTPF